MLPSALAILAVAAVVLLLIGIFGDAGDQDVTSGPGTSASPDPVASSPPPPPVTESPSTTPATTAAATTTPPLPTAFPTIVTVVLNSTSETGLASRVSGYLGALGWAVGDAGNFETPVEQTTVFYPEGYEEAARSLAAALPGGASLVAPVTDGVPGETLTVVLGADATGWLPAPDEAQPSPSEPASEPAPSPTT